MREEAFERSGQMAEYQVENEESSPSVGEIPVQPGVQQRSSIRRTGKRSCDPSKTLEHVQGSCLVGLDLGRGNVVPKRERSRCSEDVRTSVSCRVVVVEPRLDGIPAQVKDGGFEFGSDHSVGGDFAGHVLGGHVGYHCVVGRVAAADGARAGGRVHVHLVQVGELRKP